MREDLAKSCDTPGKAQGRPFVPGGQSTQMIVGATPESDFQMMSVAQALYHNFGLKRVFYSAYIPVNQDESLPSGVVMKRAVYFITCRGKMMGGIRLDQDYITSCLIGEERRSVWDIEHKDCYRQLSLFDDMKLEA